MAREFWVQFGTPDIIAESLSEAQACQTPEREHCPWHHVIEYSAYQKLQKENAQLKLDIENINKCADSTVGALVKRHDELREHAEKLAEALKSSSLYLDMLAYIPAQSRRRELSEEIWECGMFERDKADEALAAFREKYPKAR